MNANENEKPEAANAGQDVDVNEELRKLLATPLSIEDYRKAAADIEVDQAKLCVVRQKMVTQINQLQLHVNRIDEQLGECKMQLGILFRRTLNAAPEAKPEAEQ